MKSLAISMLAVRNMIYKSIAPRIKTTNTKPISHWTDLIENTYLYKNKIVMNSKILFILKLL